MRVAPSSFFLMKFANNSVISIIFVYNDDIYIEIRMLNFDLTSFAFITNAVVDLIRSGL